MTMGLPHIDGVFTLVSDPELRFTPTGAAVANVRLVTNGRRFNKDTNAYEDHKVVWLNGSLWRDYAEHTVESLRKGDKVFVSGTLETREYEDRDGNKRQSYEVEIDEIGPTLRFRTVLHSDGQGGKVTREGASPSPPMDDPWATPPPDESPF